MTRYRGLTVLAALGAVLCAGCKRDTEPAGDQLLIRADESWPNIVLISVDTLRPDHVGCYGYERATSPNIDRLAREGVLFENAISSTSWTLPAHAALFTGLADTVHGCTDTDQRLAESRHTLAERFREVGYATVGFFAGPYLHPTFGLGQGFQEYVDCTSYPQLTEQTISANAWGKQPEVNVMRASHRDITNPKVYEGVKRWLDGNQQRPFCMFIHLWDVHFDFVPPPPYDEMFDPDYSGTVTGDNFFFDRSICATMPPRDLAHLIALYDGEIAWTDMHIGKILDDLDTLGLTQSTIVALVSDHGTEFFEHGSKAHRTTLYDEVIRIPMIIRYPGRIPPGQRFKAQVRITDVLPTLLELVGMPAPQAVMGQSLVPLFAGGRLRQDNLAVSELFSVGRQLRSFRRAQRKMILDEEHRQAMVFDLGADPGEKEPLPQASPMAQAMQKDVTWARQRVLAFKERLSLDKSASDIPPDVLRKLQAMGYIGEAPLGTEPATAASRPATRQAP
ncbi:MAG: sulfatase-like hydrolase/transferase [Planctomycetes bacterium]|nr:sulfatase-like hydrolase/transferase [Planctomycetota bacterium]